MVFEDGGSSGSRVGVPGDRATQDGLHAEVETAVAAAEAADAYAVRVPGHRARPVTGAPSDAASGRRMPVERAASSAGEAKRLARAVSTATKAKAVLVRAGATSGRSVCAPWGGGLQVSRTRWSWTSARSASGSPTAATDGIPGCWESAVTCSARARSSFAVLARHSIWISGGRCREGSGEVRKARSRVDSDGQAGYGRPLCPGVSAARAERLVGPGVVSGCAWPGAGARSQCGRRRCPCGRAGAGRS